MALTLPPQKESEYTIIALISSPMRFRKESEYKILLAIMKEGRI